MRYIALLFVFVFFTSFAPPRACIVKTELDDIVSVDVYNALYAVVPENILDKNIFDIYSSLRLLTEGLDAGVITESFITSQLFPKNEIFFSIFTGKELQRIKQRYIRKFPKSQSASFYTTIFEKQQDGWALRENIIHLYTYYSLLWGSYVPNERLMPPAAIGDMLIITEADLKGRHEDAFDVFFPFVLNENEDEIGPPLFTMTSGIVVAAKDGWIGGNTYDSYISGGLTPTAGNGVVIYNVAQNRMYCYFHMNSVAVKVGDVVYAGDVLGIGGNTGINAKKRGHGRHVHIEIWDLNTGKSLNSKEIRDAIVATTEQTPLYIQKNHYVNLHTMYSHRGR